MKKLLTLLFIVFCSVVFMGGQAFGLGLSLGPSAQEIGIGDIASVDLTISGLGDYSPESLGAFFVEITFDEAILSFDSVVYGDFLGDPSDPFETDILTTPSPGMVSLDEFSFLFDFELDELQPSSFTLASLTFLGAGEGLSPLGFGTIDLSDATGFTISPDTLNTASVNVTGAGAPVPEPATILLMISGLFGMGVFGRKKLIQK